MPRLATLVFALLLGCGDDASGSMDGGMHAGGSSGTSGSGGSGGSGAGGMGSAGQPMAGSGGAGSGGAAGGSAGGGGGDAGGGGSDAGPDPGEAAELLSELSEGLTAPTMDCSTADGFIIGCVSASGTYNEMPFDFSCVDDGGLVYVSTGGGGVQCRGEVSGDPFHVSLSLGPAQPSAPGAFAVVASNADTYLSFQHFARELQSHRNGLYELEGTYERRLAVVGSAELDEDDLIMKGEFAASYTPASSCTPDADGFGCDTLKVRGNFAAFPIVR